MTKDEALKMAIEALEKLARLGNGDSYGNSDGNCIAISALKAITFALAQPAMTYEQGFAHGYEAHRVEQKEPHKPEREAWFYEN